MHQHLSILALYITFIFALGGSLLLLFFREVVRKNNLFVNTVLALIVGSFATVFFLYLLAVTNSLGIISIRTMMPLFLGAILLFAFLFVRFLRPIRFNAWHFFIMIVFLLFFSSFIRDALFSYLIAWDATAIWMLKAKVFFYHSGVWNNPYFQTQDALAYSHKAYPLGFSLLVAAYYRLIGVVNDQTAQLIFLLYYLAVPVAFYGFIRIVASGITHVTTLLLTLSLFTIPNFLIYAHNGYVDVQLSFTFMMGTILLLLMVEDRSMPMKASYAVLAILATALGATFKNEGLTFFMMTILGVGGHLFYHAQEIHKEHVVRKGLMMFLLVTVLTAVPVLLWEVVKNAYGTATDPYIADAKLYANSLSRMKLIVFHYMDEFLRTSKYGLLLVPFLLLYVMQMTVFVLHKKYRFLLPSVIVLLQLCVYTAIYLVTSVPLIWQLQTSFERLLMHLLPAFFVLVVYYMKPFLAFTKKQFED